MSTNENTTEITENTTENTETTETTENSLKRNSEAIETETDLSFKQKNTNLVTTESNENATKINTEIIENQPLETTIQEETTTSSNNTTQRSTDEVQNSKLYVGNIDFSVSKETVQEIFKVCGTILSVSMPFDHQKNQHKGFCFIEFSDANSVNLAFEKMAGYELSGRELKLGRPTKNQGSGNNGKRNQKYNQNQNITQTQTQQTQNNPNCKLYVGNISWNLSSEDLIGVFSSFGPVKSFHIMKDPNSEQHKGYGFVDFINPQSAQLALGSMNGFLIGGRNLKVGLPSRNSGGSQGGFNPLIQQQTNMFGATMGFNPLLHARTNPMFAYGAGMLGNFGGGGLVT